jgi:hypothetical protein
MRFQFACLVAAFVFTFSYHLCSSRHREPPLACAACAHGGVGCFTIVNHVMRWHCTTTGEFCTQDHIGELCLGSRPCRSC